MKLFVLALIYLLASQFKNVPFQPASMKQNVSIESERSAIKNVGDNIIKKAKINNNIFNVIVAKTEQERQAGLSNRSSLAKDSGMLFLMPQKGIYPFWMKDMLFALDFVWIDGNKIVQINENISLKTLPVPNDISTIVPIDKVLELNAGTCKEANIKVGDNIEFLYD